MTTKPQTLLPLPDPPEREPDDMTSVQHLGENGNLHHLIQYLGNPETTIVSGERYIVPVPGTPSNQRIAPDMLISFNSDPALYRQDNGYVISRQGKPPDLVMEIASERTGKNDVEDKPARYAALGIPEYWRFDETGNFHGSRLAGDRLVDGQYEPIAVEEVEDGVLQGYSTALGLLVRWEHGELRWRDPRTEREIPTFEQEREARLAEQQARLAEQQARLAEQQARLVEQQARLAAEARVRELEAELARRDEEG
jgi:Uma2 family endonuclease